MDFAKSLAVFLGTVIGVGIFSLPFVAMKAGFFIAALYLFAMTFVSYKIHGFYADIALSTGGKHRLPGYAGKYLGPEWKAISFAVIAMSFVCALLAYLIVGGQFLYGALSSYFGGSQVFYLLLFFILGSFLIFREIRMISKMELALLIVIITILVLIFASSLFHIRNSNFSGFDASYFFLPYGAIVFSLWGASVVPELKEMSAGKAILKKTIFWGVIISSLSYLLFIIAVLGVSGKSTSAEAISGLQPFLSPWVIKASLIFGFLCCFTSYITIGLTLKRSLEYDFRVPKLISWSLTAFVPLLLYFLGAREFIKIIGFAGTIAIGLEALLIIFIYRACFKGGISFGSKMFSYILSVVFIIGILLEIGYFLA